MIQMLDEIDEPGFQSAAFLTYGVDLGFFEAKVIVYLLEVMEIFVEDCETVHILF